MAIDNFVFENTDKNNTEASKTASKTLPKINSTSTDRQSSQHIAILILKT